MINKERLLKITAAWISIVYSACFIGASFIPLASPMSMMSRFLGMPMEMGFGIVTFSTFVQGLIVWNILALLGAWLFAKLWNAIKK